MAFAILKKILMIIPVLLVVSFLLFILLDALPGDAADALSGSEASAEEIEELRKELGLNDSMVKQYFDWLMSVLRGDFGISMISGTSVTEKITQRFPVTLELTFLAMIISVIIALPLGIASATHRNGLVDSVTSVFATIGLATPHFWLGMLMVLLFSVKLGWLPASGFTPISKSLSKNLICMIMPAFAIGVAFAATLMRQTRSAMLDILDQDFVNTAKAKGLSKHVIIWKHALRNALIPIITVLGMQTGRLFAGAIVIETVFALPGLGTAIVDSIFSRDYQVTLGCVMAVAIMIILINTIVDILYVVIDPRISRV